MNVIETERLVLRWPSAADAPFILQLLNEPSWLRFIGDRGVRTLDDARGYIENGPLAMIQRVGFGLYITELREDHTPIGMCGLIKREGLDDVDIGFAFLPAFWSKGYAGEAAAATMEHGKTAIGLRRIVAITTPDNHASIKLLGRIGLAHERTIVLPGDDEELLLFGWNAGDFEDPPDPR